MQLNDHATLIIATRQDVGAMYACKYEVQQA
jgi:hypothetical protein